MNLMSLFLFSFVLSHTLFGLDSLNEPQPAPILVSHISVREMPRFGIGKLVQPKVFSTPNEFDVETDKYARANKIFSYDNLRECFLEKFGPSFFTMFATQSKSGQKIATSSADKIVKIWDRDRQKINLLSTIEMVSKITRMVIGPRENIIAISLKNKTTEIWSIENTRPLYLLFNVTRIVFSPKGYFIVAYADDNTITIRYGLDGKLLYNFPAHTKIAFNPDENTVATTDGKRIKIWSLLERKFLYDFPEHSADVVELSYGNDGLELAAQTALGSAYIWLLPTRSE